MMVKGIIRIYYDYRRGQSFDAMMTARSGKAKRFFKEAIAKRKAEREAQQRKEEREGEMADTEGNGTQRKRNFWRASKDPADLPLGLARSATAAMNLMKMNDHYTGPGGKP